LIHISFPDSSKGLFSYFISAGATHPSLVPSMKWLPVETEVQPAR
jgi:hypothetical protein